MMMDQAQQEKLVRKTIAEVFKGVEKRALENIFHDIKKAYSGHNRHHHNLLHIAEMIAESGRHEIPNRRAFLAAILFHDFVYEPRRYNKALYKGISNEEDSAQVCKRYLKHYGQHDIVDRSCALIRMTETHKVPDGDHEAALLMDIDMWVVGSPPARYKNYAVHTATEFLSVFSPEQYRAGRAQFLDGTLAREKIFLTPQYAHLEPAARENMQWERNNLYVVAPDKNHVRQLSLL